MSMQFFFISPDNPVMCLAQLRQPSSNHLCVACGPKRKLNFTYYPAVPRCSVAGSLLHLDRTGTSLRLQQLY
ncbi:hypothetical protein SORBI_3002G292700 [Sorghum bicolor]|uniref:Uncharacterized protein n=1 Tax=Sorghum bicolor TaxID=4558 RepID=A0A1B6QE19_SORBI|nr:hypothetical protein SORBI_3002G292700 [Sorghum bicolor]